MSAGPKLPFVLERAAQSADGAGGVTRTWQAQGTLWGVLRTRRGREQLAGGVGASVASHVVRVRGAGPDAPSRPGIRDRLRLGGRVFEVVSVVEADPLGRQLDCHLREEMAA